MINRSMLQRTMVMVVIGLAGFGVTQASSQVPATPKMPQAVDFRDHARQAGEQNMPLVVMVSADHCPFCDRVKENVLLPYLSIGAFDGVALMVELDMDSSRDITDFDGTVTRGKAWAAKRRIYFSPVTLFLDQHGNELASPILGASIDEHYVVMLEKQLNLALENLGNSRRFSYLRAE